MPETRRSSVSVRSASATSPGVSGANSVGSAFATSAWRSRFAGFAAFAALPLVLGAPFGLALAFAGLAGREALVAFLGAAMARTIHADRSFRAPARRQGHE